MLRFHRMRHPREMGGAEVNHFLTHGAGGVAVPVQGLIGKGAGA
jgi:hypothetical protein